MANVYRVGTTTSGKPVYGCSCVKQWLPLLEKMAIKRGIIKKNLDITQGGYNHGAVSASAGTHDGGGVLDLWNYSDAMIRLCREMGSASWHRGPAQGFVNHNHLVLIGCPHSNAAYQVTAYKAGYDGLGNGYKRKDPGPRVSPIRTWSEGVAWAKQQLGGAATTGDLELTVGQYENIMKQIKAGNAQAHYDAGSTQKSLSSVKAVAVENQRRIDRAKAQAHHDAGSTQVMLGNRYATLLTRLDKVIALLEEKAK